MNPSRAIKQFLALKKITPKPMRLAAEAWDADWKILIATIMSARTRDEVTIPVAEKLFQQYPSVHALANARLASLEKIILPVNFYKNKSKNVLACAKALVKDYNGKVPHDCELLIKLPGVGRKTANVFLSESEYDAIAVDTHVHQIATYLEWSSSKDPHKVEEDLKNLFPKKYWSLLNPTLVRFGKSHTKRSEWKALLDKVKDVR